jgi:hypothetical protein
MMPSSVAAVYDSRLAVTLRVMVPSAGGPDNSLSGRAQRAGGRQNMFANGAKD